MGRWIKGCVIVVASFIIVLVLVIVVGLITADREGNARRIENIETCVGIWGTDRAKVDECIATLNRE